MNDKQRKFVTEYLLDLNAVQAATRAGYKCVNQNATRLMNLPEVRAAIQAEMDKRAQRTAITADYVLIGIQEVAERCMQREPVMVGKGEDRTQLVDEEGRHVWSFDATGALKGFELLGKHLKLFTDKVLHEGTMNLTVSPEDARL